MVDGGGPSTRQLGCTAVLVSRFTGYLKTLNLATWELETLQIHAVHAHLIGVEVPPAKRAHLIFDAASFAVCSSVL